MNTAAPSHQTLLADFFELNFRIEDLITKHSLTPAQFLAFAKDPVVIDTLDTFELFQQRHQRIAARQHQEGAASHLHQCILDSPSTIETRRAATALARLTSQMLHAKAPRADDDSSSPQPADHPPITPPTTPPITPPITPASATDPSSASTSPTPRSSPTSSSPSSPHPPARATPTAEHKPTRRRPLPADST